MAIDDKWTTEEIELILQEALETASSTGWTKVLDLIHSKKHDLQLKYPHILTQLPPPKSDNGPTHYQRGLLAWLSNSALPNQKAQTQKGVNQAPVECKRLITRIDHIHFEVRAVEILLHSKHTLEYIEKDGGSLEEHFNIGLIRILLNATVMNLTRTYELLWDKNTNQPSDLGTIAQAVNEIAMNEISTIFEQHPYSSLKIYRDKHAAHFDPVDYPVIDHAVRGFIPSGNLMSFLESIQPYAGEAGLLNHLEAIKNSTNEFLQQRTR